MFEWCLIPHESGGRNDRRWSAQDIKLSPPSGRRTRRNHLSPSWSPSVARHSITLTTSSSSRAFFRSTFIGNAVTRVGIGKGRQRVHKSSMSGNFSSDDGPAASGSTCDEEKKACHETHCVRYASKMYIACPFSHLFVYHLEAMGFTPWLKGTAVAKRVVYFTDSRPKLDESLISIAWSVRAVNHGG